jgi:dephospho-CoA kinase
LLANNTLILGLAGGMGSGKSEAARVLAELGAVHIDADAISRAITAPEGEALSEIRETFGDKVFQVDGSIDRRALADVVFEDAAARRALEAIVHPRVQRRSLEAIDRARADGAAAVILDVPLLFETGMDALCDATWVVISDPEEQIRRVMERDGLTREEVEIRLAAQMTDEERAARATRVIRNDQDLEKLAQDVAAAYHQLIKSVK